MLMVIIILIQFVCSKVLLSINRSSLRAKPRDFFLVVITSVKDNTEEFLNDLFEASYAKSILTINFLSPLQNESAWLMTTFMPFVKSCNSLQQHNIAILTEQNYSISGSTDVIYPHKMHDFRQCPIIAAVFHTPPFIIVYSNGSDETVDGIDTRILGQMAQKFNFKLVYRTPRDKRGRGTIYANGSVTGCIKMIVDQEANLTVGAYMRTPSRSHYMVPSESYIQVALGFAVLPSEDISTPMERILAPFTMHLWECTSLLVTLAVIIILITKTMTRRWRHFAIGGDVNRAPILNMWNSFLGGSIGNPMFATARYLSTFARTLLVIWSTGCLVLRGSYQGALYDFMQREDLSSPLDTISKINHSDCDLIVMSTATSSLDEFYFDRSRHLTYNYSQQRIFQQVFDRELTGAVYCNDLQMKYFNLLNPLRRLQMTKDRLFLMSVVIYFNHVSALQPIFDQELLLLTDSGLIQYWAQEFTDGRLDSKKNRQRIPKKLNIQNVLAIFEICLGLLTICLLVFVLEKIGTRFTWLRNIIEKLTY
ncbi:glutamate receptor ionotropic, delta-2-like [Bradysia coprophila]|uniref:glutamate receptor ionotropic, delta-2-like n=1 Tax=Bradysia coprophila TaxID=38358 RepID=UPI00187DBCC3|nr:glutamate receptor ionotropic, delta-2-like [Bradysia coprophila]